MTSKSLIQTEWSFMPRLGKSYKRTLARGKEATHILFMFSTFANVVSSAVLGRFGVVRRPSFVTFFVTWACNHRCVFCDVWKKPPSEEMSQQEIASVFSRLGRLDVVRISGGEPFTRKDLAGIINDLDHINRPSLIHLTTNGILTGRIVETLSSVHNLKKVHIKVSIDDLGEKHDRIRGVPGAFEKAMATVEALARLRDKSGLHVGVNQAILDEDSLPSYEKLKDRLDQMSVPIYASIAYDSRATLYRQEKEVNEFDPESSVRPFGQWTPEGICAAMKKIAFDNKRNNSRLEQMVDNYFMSGLYERMIEGKCGNGPRCVALNDHLRILPNGDVPICLYNGTVVGNLLRKGFEDIWFGDGIKPWREWVNACPGCWSSCETAISAIYTGDIWKGLKRSSFSR